MPYIYLPWASTLVVTTCPAGAWAAWQARNLLMDLGEHAARFRFLIGDRDGTFTAASGEVFDRNGTRDQDANRRTGSPARPPI